MNKDDHSSTHLCFNSTLRRIVMFSLSTYRTCIYIYIYKNYAHPMSDILARFVVWKLHDVTIRLTAEHQVSGITWGNTPGPRLQSQWLYICLATDWLSKDARSRFLKTPPLKFVLLSVVFSWISRDSRIPSMGTWPNFKNDNPRTSLSHTFVGMNIHHYTNVLGTAQVMFTGQNKTWCHGAVPVQSRL